MPLISYLISYLLILISTKNSLIHSWPLESDICMSLNIHHNSQTRCKSTTFLFARLPRLALPARLSLEMLEVLLPFRIESALSLKRVHHARRRPVQSQSRTSAPQVERALGRPPPAPRPFGSGVWTVHLWHYGPFRQPNSSNSTRSSCGRHLSRDTRSQPPSTPRSTRTFPLAALPSTSFPTSSAGLATSNRTPRLVS